MESGSLSGKQKFDRDRQYGEDLEERMLTALEWSFPQMMWEKHQSCSGTKYHCHCFDLEDLATQRTIECKKDWTSMETGNFCFETYLADAEKCKADYLAHEASLNEIYLFDMWTFREWIGRFGQPIMVGDGKRTEAWIIDKKTFLANVTHQKISLLKPLSQEIFR